MGLLDRLRSMRRTQPASRVGVRPPTSAAAPPDTERESALRAKLVADPNDVVAFTALAEIVRRRAHEDAPADPLIAHHDLDRQKEANIAVWALASELAASPRGWYPLIELARLSLQDDHEAALRRLNGACERDSSGQAVAEGVRMLREASLATEALGLGVGQWAPRQHVPEAGRQVVLAALDAGRPADARRNLDALANAAPQHAAAAKEIRGRLEPMVEAAEAVAKVSYMTETGTVPAIRETRQKPPEGKG